MSRRKVSQTVAKQPVKKTPAKRAPKSQQVAEITNEEPILTSVVHEEPILTSVVHEEPILSSVVHDEPVAVAHEEVNVSVEHEETVVIAHEEATAVHHDQPNESGESSKGIVQSIIAFKESNETQFYGIVAIAIFVLIIIL
jgi:hypothetical protein